MVDQVTITQEASQLTQRLKQRHGALLFHISGGCCEGSAPMCFRVDDFKVGSRDVQVGIVEGCPVYVGAAQHEYWKDAAIEIDVAHGEVESFSIEAADGVRFTTRSRPIIRS
jgi:uncharacterized protein (DUF779 family)